MNFTPFITLARKEILRIFRIWTQTLIPPIMTVSIYFIIFHHLFSQSTFTYYGFNYLQFLTAGLIIMPVITGSYGNTAGSFFTLKFQNAIEEILVSPITPHAIIWGFLSGSIVRGTLTGLFVLMVSVFFTNISIAHPFEAFFILVDVCIIFGLGGLINAIYAKKFDDIGIVPSFILTPLTYLGGVFFAVSSLPASWQWATLCNPIFYLVSAFRYTLLGVTDIPIHWAITFVVIFSFVLYGFTYYLLSIGKNLRS